MQQALARPAPGPARFSLDSADFLGALLVAPAIVFIVALVAVPFFLAVYYSVSAYNMGTLSFSFVGLQNFIAVTESDIFRRTLLNTFIFTVGSNALALVLGKITALLLLREFPGRALVRCLLILPWRCRSRWRPSPGAGCSIRSTASSIGCWSTCTWSTRRCGRTGSARRTWR